MSEQSKSLKSVDALEFIEAWQTSDSAQEVADKLRVVDVAKVRNRAQYYRSVCGVPLKRFVARRRDSKDWLALAEYAKSLLNGHADGDATK